MSSQITVAIYHEIGQLPIVRCFTSNESAYRWQDFIARDLWPTTMNTPMPAENIGTTFFRYQEENLLHNYSFMIYQCILNTSESDAYFTQVPLLN